jgi:RHS repeat-associated protein
LGRFTGKERDVETGLDYFGARYFSAAQGRFISADWSAQPVPVPYADFTNPQTLNLYAYVKNNPLATADLDGHGDWWSPDGKKLGTDGANDGAVHVADPKNVAFANGQVNPSGTTDMYNISGKAGNAIWNAIDATRAPAFNQAGPDLKGNNHEEAFTMDKTGNILVEPSGPAMKPTDSQISVSQNLYSNTALAVHTHAGATPDANTLGGKLYDQNPSQNDKNRAAKYPDKQFAVAGSADSKVRFYDGKGTKATIPLEAFPRCQNGQNCFK